MAIHSFKDPVAENFFRDGKPPRKQGWANAHKLVKRKLDMIHYAKKLQDLRSPPSNHLETLERDLKGYHSIRVNDQWRIVFRWDHQAYDVQVMDYH